jgi:hypothetical protein
MRFAQTYCSQCGEEQGPGDNGVSHCRDHLNAHVHPVFQSILASFTEPQRVHADLAYNEMKRTGELDRLVDRRALVEQIQRGDKT